jgi:hypothetical protein
VNYAPHFFDGLDSFSCSRFYERVFWKRVGCEGGRSTPDMFVIDPSGKLIYAGAIDDRPTADVDDIKVSRNYVSEALTEAMAGEAVATSATRPYGCAVKYRE